ncbi:hypothetical protein Gpo141_00004297 [Globisporangium polare]
MTVLLVSHDIHGLFGQRVHGRAVRRDEAVGAVPSTLSHFVELHPEAKHYEELKSSDTVFNLPQPGQLSRILTMDHSLLVHESSPVELLQWRSRRHSRQSEEVKVLTGAGDGPGKLAEDTRHLDDFNLAIELGTHGKIRRGISGGR